MILQINQTAASGRNEFEIKENGQLLFRAAAPFYKPVTPVGGDVFRKLTLKDSLQNTSAKMKTSVWSNSLKTLTALAKIYN